jgi:elongation factor Tu
LGEEAIMKLADALDTYIPMPKRAVDGAFLMPVEDVFHLRPRHCRDRPCRARIVKVGEEIEIVGIADTQRPSAPASKCSANCSTKVKQATTSASCCAAPSAKTSSAAKCCASQAPSSHTHFTGEIYVLSKDEGGRHTPFFNNYRPQFYFRTTDVTGAIELPEGKEMVMPGDNVSITVKLINPIAMEEGLRSPSVKAAVPLVLALVPKSSRKNKSVCEGV